ncbi:hypothetical protein V5E97_09005 [Singulisphaera sp. Ch08]|uniref:Oligosaccharide repeat unit polymerase n=1 Tax=Singulisphaera sp. Ch08 TaxID=3120278 RepID=A0AAU7CLS6_9BACT
MQEPIAVARPNTESEVIPSVKIACVGSIINIVVAFLIDNYITDFPYLDWVPLGLIVVTIVTCGLNAMFVVWNSTSYLWSPLPWFLMACSAYFGVGPTMYYFANPETVAYMDAFFPVDMAILQKACVVNSAGILVVCLTWYTALNLWPASLTIRPRPMDSRSLKWLALCFLFIGLPVKYLFILPRAFGLTDYVLSGSIQACGYFTYFATFILVYLIASGRAGRPMTIFSCVFVAVEILTQLLLFSKLALFQALIMIFFGVYSARPTVRVLAASSGLMVVIYILVTPFALWCRAEAHLVGEVPGLAGRLEIVGEYLTHGFGEFEPNSTNVQWSWMRLTIAPMQAFAIDAFDRGNPGESLWVAAYTLIPRFLWANKPMIGLSNEFNLIATGYATNNTSPGMWGDLYWNGGWMALILGCLYIGLLHAGITKVAVPSMKVSDFRALPLAFFGLLIGIRVEDFFVLACVAPVPICLAYYIVVSKFL